MIFTMLVICQCILSTVKRQEQAPQDPQLPLKCSPLGGGHRLASIDLCSNAMNGSGYYCTIFLRPKKTGAMHPILHLKPFNQFLVQWYIKMDHLGIVLPCLQKGMWTVSMDLTEVSSVQFRSLCFGLRTAPRVVT